ncbi:hypothetical protein QEN19_000070 [Hanseniaspora menglaensis]
MNEDSIDNDHLEVQQPKLNDWNSSSDHCKICRDEGTLEEPLFTPCKCIGSIGKIHEQCLYNWIIQKLNIHDIDSYIKKDPISGRYVLLKNIEVKCDICRNPYTFKTVYKSDNIKDLTWAQFLAPLFVKIKRAIRFGSLTFLVGLIVLVIVPNYWITLRNFLESVVNSFFSVNRNKSINKEAVEVSSTNNGFNFINKLILNSYKGILDIIFVGLVVLSIYFSQDLINSEYIFKEMLLQKMGHIDIIDLNQITVPYTTQITLKCFQLLKSKIPMGFTSFDKNFSAFSASLRLQMTEIEVEAFVLKTIKESSDDLSKTLSKAMYHIPKEFSITYKDQLQKLVLEKIRQRAQNSTLINLFKDSNFFDQLSARVFDNQGNLENNNLGDNVGEQDNENPEVDLFLHSSDNSEDDQEYQPPQNESSSDESEANETDDEINLSDVELSQSDDEANQRINDNVDILLNQLRDEVVIDREEPQFNQQAQANDEGALNVLTIRFSFKNLPKYCLIGCGVASAVLFFGFAIPFFSGRVVLTILRALLQIIRLPMVQIRYKNFSAAIVVDHLLGFLDYENHPTFRRVIPCCVFFVLVSLAVILYASILETPRKPYSNMPLKHRSLYKNIFHIKQLLKTYIIISIELLVFPIMSGMMIDAAFIAPLIINQNRNETVKFFAVYQVLHFLPNFIKVICHAAIGTIYMLSMATFIGMIRSKILRNGVLYFVRSPEDPNRKILRDCLATSFRLQFRKLAQSMIVYMGFIFGGFGITTRIILPILYDSLNKSNALVSFFIFEKPVTLMTIGIFIISMNLCYLSFYSNKEKAAKDLESIWRRFFTISCKRLRLSHYILNDSNIDERGIIVYRSWFYKFLNSKEAQFSNLELYTEPKTIDECTMLFKEVPNVHCYFVPNGDFYRVPGSDILSTKFIRTLFVVVTKTDKVIHSKEVRPKIGYRGEFDNLIKESETFDKYDVIYCPPNFFSKSIALLVEVNLFAIFFIIAGVLLSNFLGQFIVYNVFRIFFGDNFMAEFNKDGVYFEFVSLGFAIMLETIYRVAPPIKVTSESIKTLTEIKNKGARLIVFLLLKYLIMLVMTVLSTQPFNYVIYLVFGDWKNNFAKENLSKSSFIWLALNLFSIIRPHAVCYIPEGEDALVTQHFSINDENGPLNNMLIPSLFYKYTSFYSPESILPEIAAVISNINIKVFVQLFNHMKVKITEFVLTKSTSFMLIVVIIIAIIVRFAKYIAKLRRNYENEILFEARILQNADD